MVTFKLPNRIVHGDIVKVLMRYTCITWFGVYTMRNEKGLAMALPIVLILAADTLHTDGLITGPEWDVRTVSLAETGAEIPDRVVTLVADMQPALVSLCWSNRLLTRR